MKTTTRNSPMLTFIASAYLLVFPQKASSQIGPTNLITPTVTREMGAVGGKCFGAPPDPAKTAHYVIAAESEIWD